MPDETVAPGHDAMAALEARASRAEAELAAARLEIEALRGGGSQAGHDSLVLNRLVETLRWADGPRALRMVLPLARLIRAMRREAAVPAGPPAGQPARAHAPSLSRRVLVSGYRMTRPVALPLARRLHALLTRVLDREAMQARRMATPSTAAAGASADLLRSIEAALLTIALQRRDPPA